MIQAYIEGKDLYAVIASASFNVPYEDCLEFYPEGTVIDFEGEKVTCGYKTHQNKAGKQRRTFAKSILLGILYGRGAASVGEQIGKSREEAQEIIDKFFNAFPAVHKWINSTIENAHKFGYVEDIAGRRRRLPDIQLPKYTVTSSANTQSIIFNPIFECKEKVNDNAEKLIKSYEKELTVAKYKKDIDAIKARAEKDNISIKDNTGFIAQAERQAVNSRVQGGAATITKAALIEIFNDERLRNIGAYLVNTVHDEILLEAPEQHAEEAQKYLVEDMINAAKTLVTDVPQKCDPYMVSCWYLDEFFVTVENEFTHMLDEGLTDIEAFEKMCELRQESTRDQIYEIVHKYMQNIPSNISKIYS